VPKGVKISQFSQSYSKNKSGFLRHSVFEEKGLNILLLLNSKKASFGAVLFTGSSVTCFYLLLSSSEMTRWIAAFSPMPNEVETETLYNERDG